MISFRTFTGEFEYEALDESIQGLPGKNRGYVHHERIDGHDVHVRYRRGLRKSTYVPSVTVNGVHYREGNFSSSTAQKITGFAKSSVKKFMKEKKPGKLKIRAGGDQVTIKAKAYQAFGHSKTVAKAGYDAKDIGKGVILTNPANRAQHVPSGVVARDRTNPAQDRQRGKKWWKSDKDKKYKSKKWSNKDKGGKFDLKGRLWKGIAGGAIDGFGGGGASGSW